MGLGFSSLAQDQYINGNLAIGASNRTDIGTLHVTSSDTSVNPVIRIESLNDSDLSFIRFQAKNSSSANKYADILFDPNTGNLAFKTPYNSSERMTINTNGNIGIGTSAPKHKLHIEAPGGNNQIARIFIKGTGQNHAGTANNIGLSGAFISGTADDASFGRYNVGIESWNGIGFRSSFNDKAGIIFNTRSASAFFEGNVGIGIDNTKGYKLAVEGKIRATEIKVEALPWPDFVFEDGYELRTLEETEQFINENKHLPDLPKESEVLENGINLGKMDAKLLQKIEELTLYMIEMNKELKIVQEKNLALEEEIRTLKKK